MKWKTLAPKLGDEKTEVRFAFFPTYTDDGYTVWLEEYVVHLRYETRTTSPRSRYGHTRWFNIKTESYTRPKSILKK